MKIFVFLIFILSSNLWAKSKLPLLEEKMWRFLRETQVRDQKIIRTKGGWPSFSRFRGTQIKSQESNSFVTIQLLVALSNIESSYELEGFKESAIAANIFLDQYLADSRLTNEPAGTMAYWPLIKTPSGKFIRSFSTSFIYRNLAAFNIPNDLDVSANYFQWIFRQNSHLNFQHDFAKTSGEYLDLAPRAQYSNDKKWKSPDSGAFLTWVEADKNKFNGTRIFGGINDVDCVVNLNILTALLTYQNHRGELSPETANGLIASCKLINEAIINHNTDICGVWYDRQSQFYTAYAKAYLAQEKNDCLNDSLISAQKEILNLADSALTDVIFINYTNIAEIMTSLKKLWPLVNRPIEIQNLLQKLTTLLKQGILVEKSRAYVKSTDSLFKAQLGPITVDWYSPQFSTAIALEALLLP